jgi:hypothetical protein
MKMFLCCGILIDVLVINVKLSGLWKIGKSEDGWCSQQQDINITDVDIVF